MRKNERDSASATALRLLSHQDAATTNDPFSFSLVYIYTFVFLFLTMLPVNRNKRSSYFFPACKHNKMEAIKKKKTRREEMYFFFKEQKHHKCSGQSPRLVLQRQNLRRVVSPCDAEDLHGLMLVPTSRYTPFCFPFLFLLKKTSSSKNRKSSLSIHAMQHAYKKKKRERGLYPHHGVLCSTCNADSQHANSSGSSPHCRPSAGPASSCSSECCCQSSHRRMPVCGVMQTGW